MYIFGGFNSLLLSDILKYTPERCEAFDNETACLRAGPGIRCVWAATVPGCVPWEMATVQQQQKVFEDCPSRPGMRRPLSVSLSKGTEGYFPFQILSRGSCVLLRERAQGGGLWVCFCSCPWETDLYHGHVGISHSISFHTSLFEGDSRRRV